MIEEALGGKSEEEAARCLIKTAPKGSKVRGLWPLTEELSANVGAARRSCGVFGDVDWLLLLVAHAGDVVAAVDQVTDRFDAQPGDLPAVHRFHMALDDTPKGAARVIMIDQNNLPAI